MKLQRNSLNVRSILNGHANTLSIEPMESRLDNLESRLDRLTGSVERIVELLTASSRPKPVAKPEPKVMPKPATVAKPLVKVPAKAQPKGGA